MMRDRMWFFFNHRRMDSADAQPGIFANKNAGDPTKFTYVPDFTRQGRIDQSRKIYSLRLTTQISPRNKLVLFWDEQPQCSGAAWPGSGSDDGCMSNKDGWIYGGSQNNGFFGPGPNSPETGDYGDTHQKVQQVKYTSPATNKLLLEAGFGTYISQWGYQERPGNLTEESDARAGTVGADLRSSGQQSCDGMRRLPDGRWQPEVPLIELADGLHLRAHVERVSELRDWCPQHEVRVSGCISSRR